MDNKYKKMIEKQNKKQSFLLNKAVEIHKSDKNIEEKEEIVDIWKSFCYNIDWFFMIITLYIGKAKNYNKGEQGNDRKYQF